MGTDEAAGGKLEISDSSGQVNVSYHVTLWELY